jgi:hypothetical protein
MTALEFRKRTENFARSGTPAGAAEAHLLRQAKKYYYGIHRPFRDLKIAGKAVGEFLQNSKLSSLRWAFRLASSAVRGAIVYRTRRP